MFVKLLPRTIDFESQRGRSFLRIKRGLTVRAWVQGHARKMEDKMLKRLPYLMLMLFLALAVPLRATPPIGAVVQTWHYDPQANTVTVRIANTSDKNITAFNISITETFGDHSVNNHETLVDMLAAVVLAQKIKGTSDEDRIRTQLGDGT